MVPRQMIIPAFWAKNSEKLAGYDWTQLFGVNSPVGQILAARFKTRASRLVILQTVPLGPIKLHLAPWLPRSLMAQSKDNNLRPALCRLLTSARS